MNDTPARPGGADVELARVIAVAAHAGQTDKAGEPYHTHPARVAGAAEAMGADSYAVAAAWLHDVVEDTPLGFADLSDLGVAARTIEIVEMLTRRDGETHTDAVRRAAADPDAKLVKICDVRDNADPGRLSKLDTVTRQRLEAKYAHALEQLGAR